MYLEDGIVKSLLVASLLLVAMPGAPRSVLITSSDALVTSSDGIVKSLLLKIENCRFFFLVSYPPWAHPRAIKPQ